MIVYVLKSLDCEAEYSEMDEIIGVFSTKEKAETIKDGRAKELFTNSTFEIEEWELDDFSWEVMESKNGNFSWVGRNPSPSND